jgi:hypothetical protein
MELDLAGVVLNSSPIKDLIHPNPDHCDLNFTTAETQLQTWNILTKDLKKAILKEFLAQVGVRIFNLLFDIGEGFYTEDKNLQGLSLKIV